MLIFSHRISIPSTIADSQNRRRSASRIAISSNSWLFPILRIADYFMFSLPFLLLSPPLPPTYKYNFFPKRMLTHILLLPRSYSVYDILAHPCLQTKKKNTAITIYDAIDSGLGARVLENPIIHQCSSENSCYSMFPFIYIYNAFLI